MDYEKLCTRFGITLYTYTRIAPELLAKLQRKYGKYLLGRPSGKPRRIKAK